MSFFKETRIYHIVTGSPYYKDLRGGEKEGSDGAEICPMPPKYGSLVVPMAPVLADIRHYPPFTRGVEAMVAEGGTTNPSKVRSHKHGKNL